MSKLTVDINVSGDQDLNYVLRIADFDGNIVRQRNIYKSKSFVFIGLKEDYYQLLVYQNFLLVIERIVILIDRKIMEDNIDPDYQSPTK